MDENVDTINKYTVLERCCIAIDGCSISAKSLAAILSTLTSAEADDEEWYIENSKIGISLEMRQWI